MRLAGRVPTLPESLSAIIFDAGIGARLTASEALLFYPRSSAPDRRLCTVKESASC